jgi:hypothetical protein
MGKFRWFVFGIVAGLSAAAIGEELKQSPEHRAWRGTVAGVPYNFRLDEWSTIAKEYWDPTSNSILTPHAVGLGWGVNFAAVVARVRAMAATRVTGAEREQTPEHQYR